MSSDRSDRKRVVARKARAHRDGERVVAAAYYCGACWTPLNVAPEELEARCRGCGAVNDLAGTTR